MKVLQWEWRAWEETWKNNIWCLHVCYANEVINSCGLKTRVSIQCCISEPSQEAVRTAHCSRLPRSSAFEVRRLNRCEEHLVSSHFYAHGDFILTSKEASCVYKGENSLLWCLYLSTSIRIFFLLMKMAEFTLKTVCDETWCQVVVAIIIIYIINNNICIYSINIYLFIIIRTYLYNIFICNINIFNIYLHEN